MRNLTKDEVIELVYCKSEDQVADIFTKPFKLANFLELRKLKLVRVCTMEDLI